MVNRQTGCICNFYSNGDELEGKIRDRFADYGMKNSKIKTLFGKDIKDVELTRSVKWVEGEGARLFKKRFGGSQTKEGALGLITEFGLANSETEANEVLQYMVDNDIPNRQRSLVFDPQFWGRFTLVPNKGGNSYRLNPYKLTLGDLGRAWNAAASVYD